MNKELLKKIGDGNGKDKLHQKWQEMLNHEIKAMMHLNNAQYALKGIRHDS